MRLSDKIRLWLVAALFLGFLAIRASAQTNIYLYTGAETDITLSTGFYEITAYGAQGAYGGNGQYGAISSGGPGAEMSAEFYFSGPTILTLLVGGGGSSGIGYPGPGGGGGGSFVVNGGTPLLIAGGGGGGGNNDGNISGNGDPGLSVTTGGSSSDGGTGGTNGSGGGSGSLGAGGGGGYEGAGANGADFNGGGGASFIGGGTGGIDVGSGGGNGGFGGGGGGGYYGGGGGGGYSGGGAGTYSGGGGGGSYIDSSAIAILNETSGAGDGSVNGEIIIAAVSPPLSIVILTQPSSQAVPGGQTATFSVSAVNSPPFSYQWLFNGTNIPGATNATYSISDVQTNNDGAYSVFITDATTQITSSNAVLTVIYPPPVIVSPPTNEIVIAGSNAVFSVDATNFYPVSFQWQFNGTNLVDGGQISGSTNSTLTISGVEDANAGSFQVIAYDDYGAVTSSIVSLTVLDPIQIITQPVNQALLPGGNATFTVTATGTTPDYQWYFDGAPLTDGGNVSGSMSATLSVANVQPNNGGNYTVIVTNSFSSSISSNATLALINPAPVIISPPANLVVVSGSNAVFSIVATNYFPVSFQWLFNGTNLTDGGQISGSLSSNLMISSVQAVNAGSYQVIVSDNYGAVTSSIVSLTVDYPVQITGQPASESLLATSNATFTVTATGMNLNYQWFFDGQPLTNGGNISGSQTATLNLAEVQTNNDGDYTVQVTNLASSISSSNAFLTVYNPAQIVTQPANAGTLLGSNASFTVSATGTAIGYQWYFEGTPLTDNGHVTGSATPTLSIANVGNSDGGDYTVLISNLLSSATSRLATLTPLASLAPSIRYVNLSNSTPASPYLSWSTAATNIQTAVNACLNGDDIIVTDGVYQASGNTAPDGVSSCIIDTNAITLQSVNGPATTLICGSNLMRCVYLANGAMLSGFTLTNGYSSVNGGGAYCASTNSSISNCLFIGNSANQLGGGVYSGVLNNCTLQGNYAEDYGGGAYGSILTNCLLAGNFATNRFGEGNGGGGGARCTFYNCSVNNNASGLGGGAENSTLNNCTISNNLAIVNPTEAGQGGGVYGCVVQNSLIISNSAQVSLLLNSGLGGGAYNSTLSNCVIQGNHAGQAGGVAVNYPGNEGMSHCALIGNWAVSIGGFGANALNPVLTNCVISGNRAGSYAGVYGATLVNCSVINNAATNSYGGIYRCTATNSIVYYNTAASSPNVSSGFSAKNCCFGQDATSGTGFFTNAPLFVNLAGGDFHLQSNSPCINAGNNAYTNTTTDLDGNPRVVGGTVDIGAYEYQTPVSMVSYEWLEQYGLPITNNIDTSSPDGTAFDVYQDWIAGLNPTNPASVLAMLPVTTTNTASGIIVMWQSVSGIDYNLQRSTNLSAQPPFSTIRSNIVGNAGTTSYTDTSATNGTPYFYRVGVP